MSGIVGVLHLDGVRVEPQLLLDLTSSLRYRGPDSHQTWVRENVGLGRASLRTADEPPAEDGPATLDGKLWITADVRLDGRSELLAKLRAHGERPAPSASDSNLILRSYRAWGPDCVHFLSGDFTFILWDDERKHLFCARDPLGVRPLYHALVGRRLIVSNTLASVRQHPSVSPRLNELAVADFLLFGINQNAASTTFADIRRLGPGKVLHVRGDVGVLSERSYWTFTPPAEVRYRRESEYVDHFRDVLRTAIEDRIPGQDCAIFLSGGLDSASLAVAAQRTLASRHDGFQLVAHTWVYDRLVAHEERHYAGLVADRLGILIRYFRGDDFMWLDSWDEPGFGTPEPSDDPDLAMSLAFYRSAAGDARVALWGEDGDALFHLPSLPSMVRRSSLGAVASDLFWYLRAYHRRPPLGLGVMRRIWRGRERASAASDPGFPAWLDPDLEKRLQLKNRFKAVTDQLLETGLSDRGGVPDRFRQPLWQSVLESIDPGVTGVPLSIRLPLLDLRVISYVLAIPPLQWFPRKRLLRVAMTQELPHQVVERPKTTVPGYWEARLRQPRLASRLGAIRPVPELAEYVQVKSIPAFNPGSPVDDAFMAMRPWMLNQWLMQMHEGNTMALARR